MNLNTISPMEETDANLVIESLKGSREAFGHIVARYQTLLCSLAYSATGSFSHSQDLSQETFVIAWKKLSELREPGKLRSWLCGILKNCIYKTWRRQDHEPAYATESLEAARELASTEQAPSEQAISREEEAILWRSLERIPEVYREPLVLFYREHQSVEVVAANLDLSEDAVKQRLSRGRKLLHEQVLSMVEGTLERTNPGKLFTLAVLAALPAMTLSARAATLGVTAAKGSAAAKTAGLMGLLGAIFTPLIVIVGTYASYRKSLNEAHSDKERGIIKWLFLKPLLIAAGLSAIGAVPLWYATRGHDLSLFGSVLFSFIIGIYFVGLLTLSMATFPRRRTYLARVLAEKYGGEFPPSAFEYRSAWSLFGLPLIHIRIGDRFDLMRPPVKAWIAIGSSYAIGVIFASGGIAVAPICFGGVGIGIVSYAVVALGIFSAGPLCLGVWAFGALAIGWQVCCGCGIAWNAAAGGVVIAHNFAVGGLVHAAHANTEIARQFIQQAPYFRVSQVIAHYYLWMIWIVPIVLQSWLVKRARRREVGLC
ncbi:MAG: RNA polymerase sigma factor [Limisphaerales bacterium]